MLKQHLVTPGNIPLFLEICRGSINDHLPLPLTSHLRQNCDLEKGYVDSSKFVRRWLSWNADLCNPIQDLNFNSPKTKIIFTFK